MKKMALVRRHVGAWFEEFFAGNTGRWLPNNS